VSRRDPIFDLASDLRDKIEAASGSGHLDAEAAIATLDRLEQAAVLLRSVSLHSIVEFERRIDELSLLASIGRVFTSIFDQQRMCGAFLDVVVEVLPCENAFFYLADAARRLELKAVVGPTPPAARLRVGEAAGAMAIRGSEPLCVTDVAMDARFQCHVDKAARGSLLAYRVEAMGEALGAIVLSESDAAAFQPERVRILGPIADLAAIAVRHARVCAQNLEHQRGLEALVARRTREVNESRAALRRHERTAAMGKLAASIAHEVNNPMGYVASNIERAVDYSREIEAPFRVLAELQRLARALPESNDALASRVKAVAIAFEKSHSTEQLNVLIEDFGELLDETREGVSRIRRVGDDLRSFAQGVSGVMEPVDVNRLVDTALHIVVAEAKENVQFELRQGVLPNVLCQQYQITQVLLNLIQNAAESIVESGGVRVETRAVEDWVEVEIADDGPGIQLEQLDRIFEPFLTTKPDGSGLGLSISRDIVRAHGGSLDVQSSSEGTVFTLRLGVRRHDEELRSSHGAD
jgi:signal transduction histidine kinase